VPVECGVIEGDLGVKADQTLASGQIGGRDNGKRIDFDEVGVCVASNADEPRSDHDKLLEEFARQANAKAETTRLEGEEASVWVGVKTNDGGWIFCRNLFNLHPPGGGGHEQHASARSVDQRRQVDLARDDCSRGHEDATHGESLDLESEDRRCHVLRLIGRGGELHATRLAAAATDTLRLHHNLGRAAREESLRGGAGRGRSRRRGAIRDGETSTCQEFARFGFVDLHVGSIRQRRQRVAATMAAGGPASPMPRLKRRR